MVVSMGYGEGGEGGRGGTTHLTKEIERDEVTSAPGTQCDSVIDERQRDAETQDADNALSGNGALQSDFGEVESALASEVDDGDEDSFVDVSSKHSSMPRERQHENDDDRRHIDSTSVQAHREGVTDSFEGGDGETISEPQEASSEPKRISTSKGVFLEGELSEIVEESLEAQEDQQLARHASGANEGLSTPEQEIVVDTEVVEQRDGAVPSKLATATSITRPFEPVEVLPAWHPRLDLDIGAYYPQGLDHDDEISPYSLQERIRKAREHQDVAQALEPTRLADTRVLAELVAGAPESNSVTWDHDASAASEQLRKFATSFESDEGSLDSQSRDATRGEVGQEVESIADECRREEKHRRKEKTGVGEAILLGALASGVNKPTWFAFKAVLVALVASLVLLLHVARQSDNWLLIMNVMFLLAIAGTLIVLLSWYVSMIGLVPVEKQMAELKLSANSSKVE